MTIAFYALSVLAGVLYAWHAHCQHLRIASGTLSWRQIWFHGFFMMITRFFLLLGIGWAAVKYGNMQPIPLGLSFVVGYSALMTIYMRK